MNEEWISDKTRFACDGLRRQRLDRPYIREDGKLQPATWDDAFAMIKQRLDGLDGRKIAAIAGDQADCEAMVVLKALMTNLGSANIDCRQDGRKSIHSARRLICSTQHRRDREGRCVADRWIQSTRRSRRSECPHPQSASMAANSRLA